jgi:hypothetical protein
MNVVRGSLGKWFETLPRTCMIASISATDTMCSQTFARTLARRRGRHYASHLARQPWDCLPRLESTSALSLASPASLIPPGG